MITGQFSVTFQAVDKMIEKSTGEYDDFLEYGMVEKDQLKDLLVRFSNIELLVIDEDYIDKDTCPANMMVDNGNDTFNFIPVDKRKLYCDNIDSELSIDKAYDLIVGDIKEDDLKPKITQEQNDSTVRMRDIRPTLSNIDQSKINTASSVPQIENRVWKSKSWQESKLYLMIFGAIMLLIGFIIPSEEADSAAICFGIAIVLLILSYFVKSLGKTTFRLGIDWDTNTIWAIHGDDFSWIKDANQVIDFVILKHDEDNGADVSTAVLTDGAVTNQGKVSSWLLKVRKRGSRDFTIANFATKDEATEVLEKSQQLLNSFS